MRVSLAVILQVSLCVASVTVVRRQGNIVTITAKGKMDKDGKFAPLQHTDLDKGADDIAKNKTGKRSLDFTADLASPRPHNFHERRLAEVAPTKHGVLAERQAEALVAALFSPIGAATIITFAAIAVAVVFITNISGWSETRENFTKKTVEEMFTKLQQNSTLAALAPAAMCYNMAYDSTNPAHIGGLQSKSLESAPLSTDYDCFFIIAPCDVYTRGDGGFINMAVMYDSSRCQFDSNTADVYCPK